MLNLQRSWWYSVQVPGSCATVSDSYTGKKKVMVFFHHFGPIESKNWYKSWLVNKLRINHLTSHSNCTIASIRILWLRLQGWRWRPPEKHTRLEKTLTELIFSVKYIADNTIDPKWTTIRKRSPIQSVYLLQHFCNKRKILA